MGAQIGKGTFGTVFQCTELKTHVTYALKAMDLRMLRMRAEFQESRLMREIQVMRKLNHPFIVRLHNAVFTEDSLFLIMELIIGVDLFDTIVGKAGFDEVGGKFVFYQLCCAIDYIHDQGILHRDIKPENVLLRGPAFTGMPIEMTGCVPSRTWIKLVDFGLSKLENPNDMNSFVGTPRYIAPEVITVGEEEKKRRIGSPQLQSESLVPAANVDDSNKNNKVVTAVNTSYSTPADCFSAGICLFVMLANCFPKFIQGVIVFEGNNGKVAEISIEAKDLILKLTDPDPLKRFTMKQALNHSWMHTARPLVENLVRSETSIISLSRSPSIPARRPSKRPFLVTSAGNQNPPPSFTTASTTANNNNGFPSIVLPSSTVTATPTDLTINSFNQQLGRWHPPQQSSTVQGDSSSSPSTTSSGNGGNVVGGQIVSEIDREIWSASQANPGLCSHPEIRAAVRGLKNMLVQSERVVSKCIQTGFSVSELIPDIRTAVDTTPSLMDQTTFDFIKSMLTMIKQWIDQLKQEASEILHNNHQVLLAIGQILHQIANSTDYMTESVANFSLSTTTNNPSPYHHHHQFSALKCHQHFERVEHLLRAHENLWGRMENSLSALQTRAVVIDGLMMLGMKNPQMAERFLQKLDEYFALWQTAAILCQQFQQFNPNMSSFPIINGPGPAPYTSTVVVTNETTPVSSMDSYEGDV